MKIPNRSPKEPLTINDLEGITLTAGEAFLAMGKFVAAFGHRVRPERALATLWADIELEKDGMSTDPAALSDWLAAVQEVTNERNSKQE